MNTYKLQQMNNEIFRKNSIDLTDLSMIVNDSQLSSFNTNDNSIQISKPINFNLVNCFNNELLQLGYESIVNYEKLADLNSLFKNGIDLIERYNRQLAALQRVKEEYKLKIFVFLNNNF